MYVFFLKFILWAAIVVFLESFTSAELWRVSHDYFKESVLHKIRWERGLETVYRRLVFISISRRDLENKFCIHFEAEYTGAAVS